MQGSVQLQAQYAFILAHGRGGVVLLQILIKYPSHIIVLFISGIIGISISNLKAKG